MTDTSLQSNTALENETTHFGFTTVAKEEKVTKVAEVFHSVAAKYDIMNDLMSGG
ncbi:class I SAM-dependent methyltransferase, partial [Escherichia coli]|nr:class I SAM-dependent methyltransferase [Escherichia coli]